MQPHIDDRVWSAGYRRRRDDSRIDRSATDSECAQRLIGILGEPARMPGLADNEAWQAVAQLSEEALVLRRERQAWWKLEQDRPEFRTEPVDLMNEAPELV